MDVPTPSVSNCCIHCLQEGAKCAETLTHVVFVCPLYDQCRKPVIDMLQETHKVFALTRDHWSWSQIKFLRRFFLDVMALRSKCWTVTHRNVRLAMQDEAERIWA